VPSDPSGEGLLTGLSYLLYLSGWRLARALPEPAAYGLANTMGTLVARLSRHKRAVVERNLARITGEQLGSAHLEALVRESFRSYARYWLELFRLRPEDGDAMLERFQVRHLERLDEVLARGKGAVVVVAHLGNWDAAGAWAGASGRSVATVAEVLKPRRLFDLFCEQRSRLGMTVFAAERGVGAKLVAAARDGRMVAILGDRDLGGRGVEIDFFGARTTFPTGPASIAVRAGVPILVAGVYGVRRTGGKWGWEAEIAEPIELPEGWGRDALVGLTRQVAAKLEGFIERRPEEWHVFQPFWIEDKGKP
jgi:phosphatidylinositol dimannoside acyltransferase